MSSAIEKDAAALKNAGIIDGGKKPLTLTEVQFGHAPESENTANAAKDLLNGVSVSNIPAKGMEWYVMRATYGREILAYNTIRGNGGTAYIALRHTVKERNGRKHKVVEPLVQQFVFVYATRKEADTFVNDTPGLGFLTYYYDHFSIGPSGYNPPLTVPASQMENFIRVTSVDDEHIQTISPDQIRYKTGDMVRVTAGKFEGVTGKVARINRQNRVVVELKGVCLVATAYIPSYALEVVEE